jgi:2-iminobutanoate/2-iminopropanoate deaminase
MSQSVIGRAVKVGNLVFLSGMTGAPGDPGTQIRNIFGKISKTLEEAGSSLENVVNATVYLTDLNDRPKYLNPIWKEFFPVNPPTRTCIQAGLNPPAVAEITVIATIPEERL